MKAYFSLFLFSTTLTISATSPLEIEDDPVEARLIQQLASDSYKTREQAMLQLWAKGDSSLDALRSAMQSKDPEVAMRSTNLVRNIEVGILPTTDKSIVNASDLYRSAKSVRAKFKALTKLIELKALKQVLHLIDREKDLEIKKVLNADNAIRGIGLAAADRSLQKGDRSGALELLRIAAGTKVNLRARAHLLKHSGKLDAEIASNSEDLSTEQARSWQLILLKTKGDMAALKSFAKSSNADGTLATVALMEGNPYPVIEALEARSSSDTHRSALTSLRNFHDTGVVPELSKKLSETPNDSDPFTGDRQRLNYLVRIAMLMGDREGGEKLLAQQDESLSIEYYSAQEYSEKEFSLFKVPDPVTSAPEFDRWLANEITNELDESLGLLDDQVSKIEQLANFYNTRGEKDLVRRIIKPLADALIRDDKHRWLDLIASLPAADMGDIAVELVLERGEKEGILRELSYSLFDDADEIDTLWTELQNLIPHSSEKEQFSFILELMGMSPHDNSGKNLEERLYKNAVGAGELESVRLLELLAFSAEKRGDIKGMLKYYKELCSDPKRKNRSTHVHKYQQSAEYHSDWAEVVASYDLAPNSYLNSIYKLTTYSIAKRKLGDNDAARSILMRAKELTLGMTKPLSTIANLLHSAGYKDEASEVWLSLLLMSDTDDWDFFYVLNFINNRSKFHMRTQNWNVASAFYLIEKAVYMDPKIHSVTAYQSLKKGHMSHFTRGMELLESGDRTKAVKVLDYAHRCLVGDGSLADDFFPAVASKDLRGEGEAWFQQSWKHLMHEIEMYPKDHNARNTLAWLGARYSSRLNSSLKHSKIALTLKPDQPAYLDTLAEIYFAKNDRKNAIKYSEKSLKSTLTGAYAYTRAASFAAEMHNELLQQNSRFRNEKFSKN